MTDIPIIKVENMTYRRGSRAIFDGLDLEIMPGKTTAIMGPSGTGKTTLLKLIGAQLKPESGRILFHGEDIHKMPQASLYATRQKMGMLFQSGALFSDLSVFDNVAFPLREHTNLSKQIIRTIVLLKLHAVGLRGAKDLMPSELSGGMARRVALARAVALDPEMVMYDEPFTGQDPISMGVLIKLIQTLTNSLKLTSVVVSHDVAEVISIADYCYVLASGKVMAAGTPEEIQNNDSAHVSQFMHGSPDGPVKFHFPAPDYREDIQESVS